MWHKLASISVSALALMAVTAAFASDDDEAQGARNAQLKGAYALTGTIECIVSASPFNPNFTPSGFAVSNMTSMVGMQTFQGNGTSTFNVRTVTLSPPPVTDPQTNPPSSPLGGVRVVQADATAQVNYNIDNDGLISVDVAPGTLVQATILTPPGSGSFTLDHHQLSGMMSRDQKTIVLGTVNPLMETQINTSAGGIQTLRYRVCVRTMVLTQIDDN